MQMFDFEPCTSRTCYLVGIGCGFGAVIVLLIVAWFVYALIPQLFQQPVADMRRMCCSWNNPHAANLELEESAAARKAKQMRHGLPRLRASP